MAGHGLAKAVAFLSSGHILHRYRSSAVAATRGLGVTSPGLAAAFGLAVVALLGFPPAAVFASELGIARAGAAAGLSWVVAIAFGLALLAFAAIAGATGRMLLGQAPATATATDTPTTDTPGRRTLGFWAGIPLAAGLLAVVALGLGSGPLLTALRAAASVVATS
jgi:hydrogenase-4 component F